MSRVLLESECGRATDAGAGNRWAPVLLDVSDDQIESLEMFSGIAVIRIRQIAAQHDVLAEIHHLPNPKRTPQDAAVRMDAHDDHVFDASLREEIVDLLAVAANGVAFGHFERVDLPGPDNRRRAARLGRIAGTAALFKVFGQRTFVIGVKVVPLKLNRRVG